jgi:hypothetical protein
MDLTIKNIPTEELAATIKKFATNIVGSYIEEQALKPTKAVEDAIIAEKQAFITANKAVEEIIKK